MSTPVLLLHGMATSAERTWGSTGWIDLLRDEGRSVIAPNIPGHGATPLIEDGRWDLLHHWLLAQLPQEPVDAVGFSLGAAVVLQAAREQPARFRRIVVAGVGENLLRTHQHGELLAALQAAIDEPDTTSDHPHVHHFLQLAQSSQTDPAAMVGIMQREIPSFAGTLSELPQRYLVVLGDADFAGPAEPLLAELPAGTQLVTLRGTDHFSTPKSMQFLDAALRFLANE